MSPTDPHGDTPFGPGRHQSKYYDGSAYRKWELFFDGVIIIGFLVGLISGISLLLRNL